MSAHKKNSTSDPSGSQGLQLDSLQPIYSISTYCLATVTICLAYAHHSQGGITDPLQALPGEDSRFSNTRGSDDSSHN